MSAVDKERQADESSKEISVSLECHISCIGVGEHQFRRSGMQNCSAFQKKLVFVNTHTTRLAQVCLFVFGAKAAPVGQGLLIHEVSRSHVTTHRSVGLLWTSDQPAAETSTWQHTTLKTDRHPCPRWDYISGTNKNNPVYKATRLDRISHSNFVKNKMLHKIQ